MHWVEVDALASLACTTVVSSWVPPLHRTIREGYSLLVPGDHYVPVFGKCKQAIPKVSQFEKYCNQLSFYLVIHTYCPIIVHVL